MTRAIFDSRENHQKLLETGSTTINIASLTFSQNDTLTTHNAGYFPNTRVFYDPDDDGDIWPLTEAFWGTKKNDIRSSTWNTTTQLIMRSDNIEASALTVPVYWRIYEEGDTTNNTSFDISKSVEKIKGEFTGSFSASGSGAITTKTVAHGLGEKHFPVMRWRESGGVWVDQGLPNYNSGFTDNTNAIAHCDATNVYIEALNTYSGSKTIEYEVFLFQFSDDNVLFDSRDGTFVNFEESETNIVLSGSLASGETKDFTATITHTKGDSFGNLFLNKSSDSTKEYQMPLAPLELIVPTSGSNANAVVTTEHTNNSLVIKVRVNNASGSSVTITTDTWTFRYALFEA